jgi:hypothetical protein
MINCVIDWLDRNTQTRNPIKPVIIRTLLTKLTVSALTPIGPLISTVSGCHGGVALTRKTHQSPSSDGTTTNGDFDGRDERNEQGRTDHFTLG